MHIYLKKIISSIIVLLFLLLSSSTVHAYGITPSKIIVPVISNNSSINYDLRAQFDTVKEDLVYKPSRIRIVKGPKDLDVLTFPISEVKVKKGDKFFNFPVTLNPKSLPNGEYSLFLNIFPERPKLDLSNKKGAGMDVYPGFSVYFKFTVDDKEVRDYTVSSGVVNDGEESFPPYLTYMFRNNGNINDAPDKVVINMVDVTDRSNTFNEVIQKQSIKLVKPQITEQSQIGFINVFPTQGKYMLSADFYFGEKVIYAFKEQRVTVFPDGTLDQTLNLVEFSSSVDHAEVGEFIKLNAFVKNAGQNKSKAILNIDVIKDGKIIDIIKSSEKNIIKGNKIIISENYKPKEEGVYSFEAYVDYSVKQTSKIKIDVNIGDVEIEANKEQQSAGSNALMSYWWVIIVIVIIILIIIYLLKNRSKKQKNITTTVDTDNEFL
mgnify:CR=1 FL=1